MSVTTAGLGVFERALGIPTFLYTVLAEILAAFQRSKIELFVVRVRHFGRARRIALSGVPSNLNLQGPAAVKHGLEEGPRN
ncbi:hypothetical protein OF83DRAFT_51164 [Amylostereum chailletii]|nr:hypothetical protein OF83DRAFT_51164 [Amylostereum chailletii]